MATPNRDTPMELSMGIPHGAPHSTDPSEADICRLEKAAWDANAEHVLIWYRDQIVELHKRLRETERALKLEEDRWRRASDVVHYYTGRELDQMDEEYTKEVTA